MPPKKHSSPKDDSDIWSRVQAQDDLIYKALYSLHTKQLEMDEKLSTLLKGDEEKCMGRLVGIAQGANGGIFGRMMGIAEGEDDNDDNDYQDAHTKDALPKKKGRPPKRKQGNQNLPTSPSKTPTPTPRKRGRPPKLVNNLNKKVKIRKEPPAPPSHGDPPDSPCHSDSISL